MGNSIVVTQKLKLELPYAPTIPTPDIYIQKKYKDLCILMFTATLIHNGQNVKGIQMPIHG